MTQRDKFIEMNVEIAPMTLTTPELNALIALLDTQLSFSDEKKPIKSIRPDFIHAYLASGRTVKENI